MLEMFAEDVMKQFRLTHPDYTLALPHISYYYDMELVTFGIDEESALSHIPDVHKTHPSAKFNSLWD